jgi:BirA family biotin operon repressor/biotin-[acetyl-CoA-carboxylase] ligase
MATSYSAQHLGEVSSTQDLALDGFDGSAHLVTATGQTAGRGRSGSAWQTAPRALAASLAFEPGWPAASLPLITLVAGVAAAEAIDGASLKWPNDVLIGESKVGGILAELSNGIVVVGLGVNLWWPDAPNGVAAVHADDPGGEAGPRLAERWAEALLRLVDPGPDEWPIETYRRLCSTIGREVTWEPAGSGRAVDIDPTGALIVDTPSGRVRLTSGAVTHLRAT